MLTSCAPILLSSLDPRMQQNMQGLEYLLSTMKNTSPASGLYGDKLYYFSLFRLRGADSAEHAGAGAFVVQGEGYQPIFLCGDTLC